MGYGLGEPWVPCKDNANKPPACSLQMPEICPSAERLWGAFKYQERSEGGQIWEEVKHDLHLQCFDVSSSNQAWQWKAMKSSCEQNSSWVDLYNISPGHVPIILLLKVVIIAMLWEASQQRADQWRRLKASESGRLDLWWPVSYFMLFHYPFWYD